MSDLVIPENMHECGSAQMIALEEVRMSIAGEQNQYDILLTICLCRQCSTYAIIEKEGKLPYTGKYHDAFQHSWVMEEIRRALSPRKPSRRRRRK